MRRAIIATTAAVAAVGLVLAGASPAVAAGRSIPTVDALYAIDAEVLDLVTGYSVNSSDGAAAPIGDGTTVFEHERALQAAYDVTTGLSYYIDHRADSQTYSALHGFNPATGESSDVDLIEFASGEEPDPIIASIAIGIDGKAYAIDDDDYLYSLDLATAKVTPIVQLADGQFFGFAVHPETGAFYVVNSAEIFGLDVVTGALTPVHELLLPEGTSITSLQIDSTGVFWLLNTPMSAIPRTELWSATTVDGSEVLSGNLVDGAENVLSSSLLLIPGEQPALAATGAELAPVLYAGLSVLLLGGALVLLRRRIALERA